MIEGFFTDEEIEEGTQKIIDLDSMGTGCNECGLHKSAKSPMMKYTGKGDESCLIVGEAPGANEDIKNTQFEKHAQAGSLLRKEIQGQSLELDQNFWKTNAVCCRPIKKGGNANRAPTENEIALCRPRLEQTIKDLKPKFIWLLGGVAVKSFYLNRFKRKEISRWRGLCIPDQKYQAWIIPMFHPSYIARDTKNKNLSTQFTRDMGFAVDCLSKPFVSTYDYNKHVSIITKYDDLISVLDNILEMKPPVVFFDYETTGLKPFRNGHKILSVSMCCNENHVISFPYSYRDFWDIKQLIQIKRRVRKIFTNKSIRKQAHNIKFEQVWTNELFGVDPSPWDWDSMIAAHVLDNRRGYSGLKFQTYLNYGVYPYDKAVQPYIKGFPFNKLEECPLNDLLHYGALDSLFGFLLCKKQKYMYAERGQKLLGAYNFFHEGTLAMGRIELRGICTDEEYYETQTSKSGRGGIDKKIVELLKLTQFGKEATKFSQEMSKQLDIESSKDLSTLLYDILKYPPVYTDKKNYSVDENALRKINIPFTNSLLELRKLLKLRGTYMAQFKRFSFNGRMNPSFDLVIPATYRSSSSSPNFQNIPKHDLFSKMACRKGIIPRKGRGLLSSDFSGIEVCMSACYNKDENLIKYITDEKTDMHRDSAADIWMLPHQEISSRIRFSGKNSWVFPQFYNSYYVNCAKDLWDHYLDEETKSGVKLRTHMKKKGIQNLDSFTGHCKKVEDKFWGERFKTYKLWKEQIVKEYQKKGTLETYFGFQFSGYMTRNECCNYLQQGTAFHVLLWTLLQTDKWMEKEKLDSLIVGQIHDDILTDYEEDELEQIIEAVNYYGTEEIMDRNKWIIVPLKIDHEISGIDGNWAEMEEVK